MASARRVAMSAERLKGPPLSERLSGLLRDPAFLALALLWLAGLGALSALGHDELVTIAAWHLLTFGAVAWACLYPPPDAPAPDRLETPALTRKMIGHQLQALALLTFFLFYWAVVFGGPFPIMAGWTSVFLREPLPVLSELGLYLFFLTGVPVAAALALGASRRSLGFRVGRIDWRLLAALCATPLGFVLVALLGGGWVDWRMLAPISVLAVLLFAAVEEITIRGVLLSRLWQLWGARPALIVSSLIFGLAHVGALTGGIISQGFTFHAAAFLPAIVVTLVFQTAGGAMYALAYLRTGSLLIPVVAHTVYNLSLYMTV